LGATLETSNDPIAAMVLAHLATLEAPDDLSLFARKRDVIRSLYDRGMSKQMVLELFRLIDWMMTLPEALQPLFRQEHLHWEEEKNMPYVTTFERLAREEGEAKGKAEGQAAILLLVLEQRFGSPLPEDLATRIRDTRDSALLEKWARMLFAVASLDEFRQQMQG
jgi:hypothetical protein